MIFKKNIVKVLLLSAAIAIAGLSCKTSVKNQTERYSADFQSVIDAELTESIPGILLNVTAPAMGIDWSGASGLNDWALGVPLQADQTFRIASVTKTYVAATVLRLWEENKLSLDDDITQYISAEHTAILERGGYNPSQITIRHLLSHTSGLGDHTNSHKYTDEFLKSRHVWSRTETLIDLITLMEPAGDIGAQFSYSDTGYVLLGEIIETITGQTMGEAIVALLQLKELGLTDTYLEEFEGDYSGKRIHQYYEGSDSYNYHPSFDYFGGGGLLSTTSDMSRFFHSLFNHKVFVNQSTLDTMLTSVLNGAELPMDYRLGLWQIKVNGMDAYTHSGFWGTQVLYIPEMDIAISANYSQRWYNSRNAPVISKIIDVIERKR